MRRRSLYLWGAAAFALLVVCVALPVGYYLLVVLGRQSPPVDAGPLPLTNLHTSLDAQDTQPATEFSQAGVIYTQFALAADPGTRRLVRGAVRAVEAEGLEPGAVAADSEVSFPAGPGNLAFSRSTPWPLGRYRIELAVDGQPAPPLEFAVVATNVSGAQVTNVYASTDQAGQQRQEVFPVTGSIYVHFTLVSAPVDTHVRGVIVARQTAGLRADTQITETSGRLGDGVYWFEFFNAGPWPPGDYSVYVYLNGQAAYQLDLRVQ